MLGRRRVGERRSRGESVGMMTQARGSLPVCSGRMLDELLEGPGSRKRQIDKGRHRCLTEDRLVPPASAMSEEASTK